MYHVSCQTCGSMFLVKSLPACTLLCNHCAALGSAKSAGKPAKKPAKNKAEKGPTNGTGSPS